VKGLCYNSLNRYAPSPRSTASLAGLSGGVLSILAQKLSRAVSCVKDVFLPRSSRWPRKRGEKVQRLQRKSSGQWL